MHVAELGWVHIEGKECLHYLFMASVLLDCSRVWQAKGFNWLAVISSIIPDNFPEVILDELCLHEGLPCEEVSSGELWNHQGASWR